MTEKKEQLPVKWAEELAKQAKDVAASERPSVSRISFRSGIMTYMDQRIPGSKMDCIILDAMLIRAWYPNPFDPNKPEAPDCFAFGDQDEYLVPHEKSFKKQNETCIGCPQNEWGSAGNGRKGKACREMRKLVLMPASVLREGGNIKTAELATADIPVTSIRYWASYVNLLASTEARPPWAVVTSLSCEPDPKTQIKINFDLVKSIEDKYLSELQARLVTARDILTIPYEKTSEGLSPQTAAMQTGKKY